MNLTVGKNWFTVRCIIIFMNFLSEIILLEVPFNLRFFWGKITIKMDMSLI